MFQTKSPPPLDGAEARRTSSAGRFCRHGAECPVFDDEAGAERAIGIAGAHLKEGAKCFREWQGLKAALAASIFSEALP